MADGCCSRVATFDGRSVAYRRVLWCVIALNATMFMIEVGAGYLARSQALQADALDFLADAATYALTLLVIGRSSTWRANAALFKGVSLGALALWVAGSTLWRAVQGGSPVPVTMSAVGALALAVNVGAALLLFRFRDGDANVRSVWLCSRNDAIGNVAVVLAAAAVWATGASWPDLVVAFAMSALFLHSATRIVRQASGELRHVRTAAAPLGAPAH
jgi:cation diffusion facilitator family transporter